MGFWTNDLKESSMHGLEMFLTKFVGGAMHQPVENTFVKMVFVYGTLKQGFSNHHVMKRANGRFVGTHNTDPWYTMIKMGTFPGVVVGGETSIKGEVFEVDSLVPLDRLEGYPGFYNRRLIETDYGPAWMYILADRHKNVDMYVKVVSGKWE